MTATTAQALNHLVGRVLPHLADSIDLDTSSAFSDHALITITTRGRDAGPTVIDTGIPAADLTGHRSFRGEVLQGAGPRGATLLRHCLVVGDTALLTAIFTPAGRIKAVYADTPGATAQVFDSAADYGDWARAQLDQHTRVPVAA